MKAVNLIPTDQRRAKASGAQAGGGYVVLGVLGVLLLLAVAYVITANSVNNNTTKAAKAKRQADALEAQASQMDAFTDFATIKQQRLAAVKTAAESRFDWERLMRELSRVMPAGSWLQTTDASTKEDTGGSSGAPAPRPPRPGRPERRRSPERHLRRLHAEADRGREDPRPAAPDAPRHGRGAERVAARRGRNEVTVDSCGPLYKFNVTVTFAPTDTDEAPTGTDSVPASLGGGS